jgi:hypoxanthine phosphoribosyltransferase
MEVITFNKKVFSNKCVELNSKLDIIPDLVVSILTGGGYIVDEIKKEKNFNNVRFEQVKIQRKERFKATYIINFLLKILPYKVLNNLRIYESLKATKSISKLDLSMLSDSKIEFKLNAINKESIKNILIIDDAIDTGKTMFTVKNNLNKIFTNAQIKTAVISWTIDSSIVKPDYYLIKNTLVRFPWSKDYKGKDFEKKSFSC